MKNIFKNILTLNLAVLLVAGIFAGCGKTEDPDVAETGSATRVPKYLQNLVFKDGTTQAYCPGCEKEVTWTAMEDVSYAIEESGHFYLSKNITFNGGEGTKEAIKLSGGATACVHLNGRGYTSSRMIYAESGTLNIYGGDGGQIYFNKNENMFGFTQGDAGVTQNLFGGTYIYPYATTQERVVANVGQLNLYDATVIGNVYHSGEDSSVNLYGTSTVTGTHIFHRDGTKTFGKIVLKDGWNSKLILTEADAKMVVVEGEALAGTVINDAGMGFVKEGTALITTYTQNLAFREGSIIAYCPGCNDFKVWAALNDKIYEIDGDTHYYLADDLTLARCKYADYAVRLSRGATLCLHLNGHTLTSENMFYAVSGILNIYSGVDGRIDFKVNVNRVGFAHGEVGVKYNLCGGTYTYPGETDEDRIIYNFGNVNLYDAIVNGTVYHRGADSSVNLYGSSTVNGSHVFHQGAEKLFGQIVLKKGWNGSLTLTKAEEEKLVVVDENPQGTILVEK